MDDARAHAPTPQVPTTPRKSRAIRDRESRERRRQKTAKHGSRGYGPPEISPTTLIPIAGDPLAHLEAMRLAYVREIEHCAELALIPVDRAAILLKLAKLTSLGKQHVEMHATLDRLTPEPDLRSLSRDDIDRILDASAIDVTPLPDK